MTEPSQPLPLTGATAGAILREARERQGAHIAVLAAAIKISPRKLDALEGDRYDELPNPAFTRALAQTVARALKIDPQPVLALLPAATQTSDLDLVGTGLNTPFKGRGGSSAELSSLLPKAPLWWAGLALLAAAALLLYWPYRASPVLPPTQTQTTLPPVLPPVVDQSPAPAVSANAAGLSGGSAASASLLGAASGLQPSAAGVQIASPVASSAVTGAASIATGLPAPIQPTETGATVSVTEPVWLEVLDNGGNVLFQRTIQPGEVLNFDQKLPLKMKVGNAAGAKITFRGETIDLVPLTRSNVARVVLN